MTTNDILRNALYAAADATEALVPGSGELYRKFADKTYGNAVERHNAYSWIKPNATACYLCGRKEYATPVDGFVVQDCDECERPVCQECAEVDYDGDSEGFRNTQWQCAKGCVPEPSPYCPVDNMLLDEDGECPRCEASVAAEQADDDAEDMEFEL